MDQTETLIYQGALVRLEGTVHTHMCMRPPGQAVTDQGEFHRAVIVSLGDTPLCASTSPALFEAPLSAGDEIPLAVLGIDETEAIRCLVYRRDVTDHHMEEADLGLL